MENAAATGVLQTLDLDKWKRTDFIATLEKRQMGVARFNAALDEALFPLVTALDVTHCTKLRSHISSVAFESVEIAARATEAAMLNGFVIQRNLEP